MLSELKALLDMVDKVLEKRRTSNVERMRDKVVTAIYKLGGNGGKAVKAERLEQEGGFSKVEIIQAIEMAKEQDWIIDMSTHDGMAWALKSKAIYYVKGLLDG
ncbi:MAG: hypothetical protein WBE46_01040 [Dehalococcoidia bacterium]